MNSIQMPY